MAYRLPPGPIGTSCLTCKRRHKKCDRGKPSCDRCIKGGYQCLGYGHNKTAGNTATDGESILSNSTTPPSLSGSSASSSSPRSAESPQDDERSILIDTVPTLGIDGLHGETGDLGQSNAVHALRSLFDPLTGHESDTMMYDEFPPTTPETRVIGLELSPALRDANTAIAPRPLSPDPLLFALASQIPQSVPLPPGVRDVVDYVMSRIDHILDVTYFKPEGGQIARFRGHNAWRLVTCAFARQGMMIYAKVRGSILEGNDTENGGDFIRWIGGHDQVLSTTLDQSLTPYECQERRHDILEMFYVKANVFDCATTYRMLSQLTPDFLQAVYSDPTLWPTELSPALVSIAHVFSSPRYGPTLYMLMDVIASMIYGVPHLVEYNTDIEPFHSEPHAAEWMNCVPGECLIFLAKINICRDQGLLADDWRDIERRLVTWEPRVRYKPEGLDSDKSVAWMALQETWRQTLLIYLYLALCSARTDDPRIQSSLKQLFRLIGAIKRRESPIANVHFFPQYLIAGICSRTEKQRRIVRERLGSAAETKFWVFHGPDIIPVLDHLWLGAAISGQPVTWNDYIHSRHVMLPIST